MTEEILESVILVCSNKLLVKKQRFDNTKPWPKSCKVKIKLLRISDS